TSVEGGKNYLKNLSSEGLKGKRIGVMKSLLSDSLYNSAVEQMKSEGAVIVEFEAPEIQLNNFLTLLTADMKKDLPAYLSEYADEEITFKNVEAITKYNL
ncbi:amidase, partial [Salinimicrobium sp. CDJ15-91]|nr:amidase [Salinimicrobium oceani]